MTTRHRTKKTMGLRAYGPDPWHDTGSRYLIIGIALVIIAALLSATFAFLLGVISFNSAPQTIAEADIATARKSVELNKDAQSYADLVIAQADSGNMTEAETLLAQATELKLEVTRTQALSYAKAYLLASRGEKDAAITQYQAVMDALNEAYENEKNRGGDANWALAGGKPDNYYLSALALSELFVGKGDWKSAKEQLTIFIKGNPQDAGVLIERGKVNLALKDRKAAAKDFTAALRYVPDDADALAGLKEAEGKND
jgi:tetratricopeptide (TPR) repeat protein